MRRWIKVAVWAAVFLTCAGAGAYYAAHSNPFPPGVDRSGVSPFPTVTPTATPTPAPVPERWSGQVRSFSYHQLYVGGRCTTRWRGGLHFTVSDVGKVSGTGRIHLSGGLQCDFPIAQVQTKLALVDVAGHRQRKQLVLVLTASTLSPKGSSDFGGFLAMLPARVTFRIQGAHANERTNRSRLDDEGRGTFFWSTGLQLYRLSR
ncbi:MAG: hypothetical protein ACXVQ0_09525 [Actinomycetota bacterium]